MCRKKKSRLKKKKKNHIEEAHVQLAHGHFCPSPIRFSPTKFSLHFGEKTFGGPHHHFPSPPSTKHPPKSFSSSYSLQNFPSTLLHLQTNTPLGRLGVLNLFSSNTLTLDLVWQKTFIVSCFGSWIYCQVATPSPLFKRLRILLDSHRL